MKCIRPLVLSASILSVLGGSADAQFTVQQPVVGFTSVNTTVSVPDSGGAYLGGVGQFADGERLVGPFRPGSVGGSMHAHSGMSAHVWIHDPAEMDRRLLLGARTPAPPLADPYAENARRQLVRGSADASKWQAAAPRPNRPAAQDRRVRESALAEGARHYQLGRRAEERGQPGVARLHYRAAERHGSIAARERLAALDTPAAIAPSVARSTD